MHNGITGPQEWMACALKNMKIIKQMVMYDEMKVQLAGQDYTESHDWKLYADI